MSINAGNEFETKFTLEKESGTPIEDIPFRLLLLGEWSNKSSRTPLSERNIIEIDRDNFDEVLRKMRVETTLDLQSGGNNLVHLRFEELEDFHPDKIYHQVPIFADLRETRKRLMNPETFHQTAKSLRLHRDAEINNNTNLKENKSSPIENNIKDSGNLLDQILTQSEPAQTKKQISPKSNLDDLISRLVKPYLVNIDETEQTQLIGAVDEAAAELMREILHHPNFQNLEAAWRAAYLLISRIETDSNLKIYLFEISKKELSEDLKSVKNLSESEFHRLLSKRDSNPEIDESWAAICGNFTFNSNVDDIATLMRIAKLAQLSETPFIAQANSEIIEIEPLPQSFESGNKHLLVESGEAKLWEVLRGLEESAFIGLTIPSFLGRLPYGSKSDPVEMFSFEEILSPDDNNNYLWINSSFAVALLLAQSFSLYEWKLSENLIKDINDLPVYFYEDKNQKLIRPITQFAFNLNMAEKIIENGLMPLISFRDSDKIRLARFQSIASPSSILKGRWI